MKVGAGRGKGKPGIRTPWVKKNKNLRKEENV
jgi:hypothetical protein